MHVQGKTNERMHVFGNEKCTLYPQYAGELRWPGSNMKVTLDDYQLCERMRKRKKDLISDRCGHRMRKRNRTCTRIARSH